MAEQLTFRLPSKRQIKRSLAGTFSKACKGAQAKEALGDAVVKALKALPNRITDTGALHARLDVPCSAHGIALMLHDILQECGRQYPGAASLYAEYSDEIIASFFNLKAGYGCAQAKQIFREKYAEDFK